MLSERIFFAIERIDDLLKLVKEFGIFLYKFVSHEVEMLEMELRRMHPYVRDMEAREDEQLEKRFCLEISVIADNTEDILDGLTYGFNPTNPIVRSITALIFCLKTKIRIPALIQRIHRFYRAILKLPEVTLVADTGHNNNSGPGSMQTTGSISQIVNIHPTSRNDQKRGESRQSYGHVPNSNIVGFQLEIENLFSHIQDDHTRVVGIAGMAGSGKTTLAKHLFHHADIQMSFRYKVWVCISQSWDKMEILYEIFRQTTEIKAEEQEKIKSWSSQKIMQTLYGVLSEESYLIILDDLWSVDAWNEISPGIPLSEASKVVVTTRNGVVPKLVDPAFFILETQPLDLDQSYELFHRRAFANKDKDLSEFIKLGKEMVEKCRGLPLAITAQAGALRANKSMNHWMRMSKTLTQKISEAKDSATQGVVREVLALSYHDLPYHLKQCFLYLAMFPEDHKMRTGMLIRMWVAECLISSDPLPEEEAIRIADEYLDDLCNRYLLINVKRNWNNQVNAFQLHDLVREMCTKKAKETGILKESLRVAVNDDGEKLSRLSTPWLRLLNEINRSRLRSLLITSNTVYSNWMGITVLKLKFKLLRVLVLKVGALPVFPLPREIFELIHLRYLCLEGFVEIILPTCIGNLKNLLTLDIRNSYTEGLENLGRLRGLRHFFLKVNNLEHDFRKLSLDQLENLRTLSYVGGGDWMPSEMKDLSPTLHKLAIKEIRSHKELDAVFLCRSIKCGNLQILKLYWRCNNAELKQQHMEALKQCENLWKLRLHGTIQERIGKSLVFPRNLIKLEICFTSVRETDLMDVLGSSLPCLKFLSLGSEAYLGTELTCRKGSFPELEWLEFRWLPYLKQWMVEKGAMPSLKNLCFLYCQRLHQPPEGWRFVSNVKQVTVSGMPVVFEESLELWRKNQVDLTIVHGLPKRKWI